MPISVNFLRPFVFVLVTQYILVSSSALLVAGSLSLYALAPALAQSFSRANFLHGRATPKAIQLPMVIVISVCCALPSFLSESGSRLPATIAIIVTTAYSYSLFSEAKLSTARSQVVQYTCEIIVWIVCIFIFRIDKNLAGQLGIIFIFSFQVSVFLAYLWSKFYGIKRPEIISSESKNEGNRLVIKQSYAADLVAGIGIQIIGSISGAMAAILPIVLGANLSEQAIVNVRIMHSVGAILPSLTHIFGPRVFYGNITTDYCKLSLRFANKCSWLTLLIGATIALVYTRYSFNNKDTNIYLMVACGLILSILNLTSASLLYMRKISIALICQIAVLMLTLAATLTFYVSSTFTSLVSVTVFGLSIALTFFLTRYSSLNMR